MARFDVTTIGEGQLRYSVPSGQWMERATQFDVSVTGTEANVTSLLARLGWDCGWVTSLPTSPMGRRIANEYGTSGLDMSAVVWTDRFRVATYYVEFAGPPKGTHVYYDRENTCFVNMTCDDIDWDYMLDTRLVHISGLTVPLSTSVREILDELVRRAKVQGIPISFDMNYRSRIWTPEAAAAGIEPFMQQVDVLFFARGDAQRMYGLDGTPEEITRQIGERSPAQTIITSLSRDGIVAWDREQFYRQPTHQIDVLDRIGAGDAMVAGVLHGWLQGDLAKGLRYGALTAALALTHYGDAVITNAAQLEALLDAAHSDIVR